ncbi:hypothetical protein, partial [Klebsiella pneumoniae]|uniref:hypothetical protein n=1 Tax=Klebsiella pneumoniae TaxID=573 RepID=UPI00256EEFD3
HAPGDDIVQRLDAFELDHLGRHGQPGHRRQVMRGGTAPVEGGLVEADRHAIQLNRLDQRSFT